MAMIMTDPRKNFGEAGWTWRHCCNRNGNMKKIKQLGNFMCDDGTNLPIRGRLFSAHGCSPTIYNFGGGGGLALKIVGWK